MALQELKLGLAELQRAWPYSTALLDWLEAARGSNKGGGGQANAATETAYRMGAFIWNDQEALNLFRHKVPVYYMRPYATFDWQVVLSVKPFFQPVVCDAPAIPPYPVILANSQAGSNHKFAAICSAAVTCFTTSSPFENMHLEGAYVSSYNATSGAHIVAYAPASLSSSRVVASTSSGPHARNPTSSNRYSPYSEGQPRRRGKGTSQNPPQEQCSLFSDVHNKSGKAPKLAMIVPDPAVFAGVKEETKWDVYLKGWHAFRPLWLTYCWASSGTPSVISNHVWRKLLLYLEASGRWPANTTPKNAHEHDHQEASELLTDTLQHFPTSSDPQPLLNNEDSKLMMQELSVINFRAQLLALDRAMDWSIPQPGPLFSATKLQVAQLTHRRQQIG
ncbi:hypothetical protein PQX77_021433 [Marasmius sp. AFHP31]|nr:hypothetical protein PQX77_021433 [Marasmius sp. AFHP31]